MFMKITFLAILITVGVNLRAPCQNFYYQILIYGTQSQEMSYRLEHEESLTSAAVEPGKKRTIENVLIMQGGGSLGAFACGVYKGLVKKNIRVDIACWDIYWSCKCCNYCWKQKRLSRKGFLKSFGQNWQKGSYRIIPDVFVLDYNDSNKTYTTTKVSSASANGAMFGVPKMFVPRWWGWWNADNNMRKRNLLTKEGKELPFLSNPFFDARSWTYLYDHTPLAKTLDKYIDYKKLNLVGQRRRSPTGRLIITAVDVLSAKPLIFDNTKMEIKAKHILASSGYPIYGFPWINIEDRDNSDEKGGGTYAWDGSLLSNTPVREVLRMSPRNDKNFFVVENYPRKVAATSF